MPGLIAEPGLKPGEVIELNPQSSIMKRLITSPAFITCIAGAQPVSWPEGAPAECGND